MIKICKITLAGILILAALITCLILSPVLLFFWAWNAAANFSQS